MKGKKTQYQRRWSVSCNLDGLVEMPEKRFKARKSRLVYRRVKGARRRKRRIGV